MFYAKDKEVAVVNRCMQYISLQGTFEIQRKILNGTERENKKTKKYLFQRKVLGKGPVKNIAKGTTDPRVEFWLPK